MRVVYLNHCARLSGGELALLRLVTELKGIQVDVILAEDGPLAIRLASAGAYVRVLPLDPSAVRIPRHAPLGLGTLATVAQVARYAVALSTELRRLRPDIVHTNSLKASVYGSLAARLARTPLVWHQRDRLADDYMPALPAAAVRLLARRWPDAIIANSEATLHTMGPARQLRAVIPSPVPLAKHARIRHQARIFASLGRLAPWKGQDLFLRAFAEAFPEGEERALVVGGPLFGEEDYAQALKHLAKELGLSHRVHFTGFREDVEEALSQADVLVHTSTIPEPFGQAIVQGMALGMPVIASDAGGPREIIEHGETGLLYTLGDVACLAALMKELAGNDALVRRLGGAALERSYHYAPDRIASRIMRVYSEVLDSAQ